MPLSTHAPFSGDSLPVAPIPSRNEHRPVHSRCVQVPGAHSANETACTTWPRERAAWLTSRTSPGGPETSVWHGDGWRLISRGAASPPAKSELTRASNALRIVSMSGRPSRTSASLGLVSAPASSASMTHAYGAAANSTSSTRRVPACTGSVRVRPPPTLARRRAASAASRSLARHRRRSMLRHAKPACATKAPAHAPSRKPTSCAGAAPTLG